MTTASVPVVGVDGCKAGWVAAMLAPDASRADVAIFASFNALVRATAPDAVIAIDIPIGLSDREPRLADVLARRFLGVRGSSVFPAPVRAALDGDSYADACARSLAACGKKLTLQSYNIVGKIREVDAALRGDAALAARAFEVHPEVSFAVCNGDVPMTHPKRTRAGRDERLALLAEWGRGAYARAVRDTARAAVGHDDIIDALIAAWSGLRLAEGRARQFPDGTAPRDRADLRMSISA